MAPIRRIELLLPDRQSSFLTTKRQVIIFWCIGVMPPHAPEERGFTDPLPELLVLPMHNLYLAERWILEIHTLRYAQFSKPASAPTELHVPYLADIIAYPMGRDMSHANLG